MSNATPEAVSIKAYLKMILAALDKKKAEAERKTHEKKP